MKTLCPICQGDIFPPRHEFEEDRIGYEYIASTPVCEFCVPKVKKFFPKPSIDEQREALQKAIAEKAADDLKKKENQEKIQDLQKQINVLRKQ